MLRKRRVLTWLVSTTTVRGLSSLSSSLPLGGVYRKEAGAAVEAVRRACDRASAVQRELRSGWAKDDASPVTVADFAAQAIVVAMLETTDNIIAEETAEGLRACGGEEEVAKYAEMSVDEVYEKLAFSGIASNRRWVLDPIDGTRGFLRGQQYCCALALIVDDEPVVSVIGAPNLQLGENNTPGCLALAVKDQGAFVLEEEDPGEWRRLEVSSSPDDRPLTLVEGVESSHSNHDWARAAVDEVASPATTPQILQLDSQAKSIVLADGKADCFLRLPKRGYVEKIWDVAPAALLVREAGGIFTDRRGKEIDWSLGASLSPDVDGLVAASPQLHAKVVAALEKTEATHVAF